MGRLIVTFRIKNFLSAQGPLGNWKFLAQFYFGWGLNGGPQNPSLIKGRILARAILLNFGRRVQGIFFGWVYPPGGVLGNLVCGRGVNSILGEHILPGVENPLPLLIFGQRRDFLYHLSFPFEKKSRGKKPHLWLANSL